MADYHSEAINMKQPSWSHPYVCCIVSAYRLSFSQLPVSLCCPGHSYLLIVFFTPLERGCKSSLCHHPFCDSSLRCPRVITMSPQDIALHCTTCRI